MRFCSILFGFVLLLPVAGRSQSGPASQDSERLIALQRSKFVEAVQGKHLDDCVSLYSPEAALLEPRGSRIEGQQAIHDLFQLALATANITIQFNSAALQISGDLAFDSGSFTGRTVIHGGGASISISGSYLTVYRRSADGRWLIVQQAWMAPPVSRRLGPQS